MTPVSKKLRLSSTILFFLGVETAYGAGSNSADSLAASLGLTTSTALPFPSQTMAATDAYSYIKDNWSVQSTGTFGKQDLAFVSDPDSSAGSSTPVFAVTYPAGSYSHGTGGAQFYSTFGNGFEAMLVSYDVGFDSSFDWVKGGKLPGVRGGPVIDSCSGGREPTGSDCFSTRLMWRADGAGEGEQVSSINSGRTQKLNMHVDVLWMNLVWRGKVYGYIPQQDSLCGEDGTICNSDYGFSFGRGKFKWTTGIR